MAVPASLCLRRQALAVVQEPDANRKAHLARTVNAAAQAGSDQFLATPPGLPGRPAVPRLVEHRGLKKTYMTTVAGRAALLH